MWKIRHPCPPKGPVMHSREWRPGFGIPSSSWLFKQLLWCGCFWRWVRRKKFCPEGLGSTWKFLASCGRLKSDGHFAGGWNWCPCLVVHPSWVWIWGTLSGLSVGRLPPWQHSFVSSAGGEVCSHYQLFSELNQQHHFLSVQMALARCTGMWSEHLPMLLVCMRELWSH